MKSIKLAVIPELLLVNRARVKLSRTLAALLVAFGATTPAMAAVCNGVIFYAHNTEATNVRIYRVRYHDLNDGNPTAWHTENIRDITCVANSNCVTQPQDLGSTFEPRENHNLDDIEYEYAFPSGGGWGTKDWSGAGTPNDMTCEDHRAYGYFDVP